MLLGLVLTVGAQAFACDRAIGIDHANSGNGGRLGGFNAAKLVVERTRLRCDVDRILNRTDGASLIVDLASSQGDLTTGCEQALGIVGGLRGRSR